MKTAGRILLHILTYAVIAIYAYGIGKQNGKQEYQKTCNALIDEANDSGKTEQLKQDLIGCEEVLQEQQNDDAKSCAALVAFITGKAPAGVNNDKPQQKDDEGL